MRRSDWKSTTIGSLGRIVTGKTPTSAKPELFGVDYPFITPSDLDFDRPHVPTERYLSAEGHDWQKNQILPKGSVCFTCIGATIGKLCKTVRPSFSNQQVNSVVVDAAEHDAWFVYYLLRFHGKEIASIASGAATPIVNKTTFAHFEISVPPLPTQRKIASILSAYDDLIENNSRRIAILEEMAQAIYREWFVNFRFPGHENVELVDSPLGKIPEGWKVKPLGEVAIITMGTSPKGDTYNEEGRGTPLVNGPVEFGERFTRQIKWTTAPKKFCNAGDLVVCVRGSTTGKYVKSDSVYCLGRGVCGLSGKYQCFIDQLFANELPALLAQTGGSTFPSWTGPQLKDHPVLSPPIELLKTFQQVVEPMNGQVLVYSQKNQNLRTTRDLVLPKLISGQLDVEDLDIDAGMTAEELTEAAAG
jgi:type I restriction enzyme S subunit